MQDELLVSVVMPVHNTAATLKECLQSLKAQTLERFEILLIDDGSTDCTVAVASDVWGSDPRLRIVRPGRVGLVGALNLGLELSCTPLVARMDGDDIAAPERLEKQYRYLRDHPQVDCLACCVRSFDAQGPLGEGLASYDAWQNRLLSHEAIRREMYVESPLAHPTVMFRRERVVALGGYRDMGWPEDYDLWLRLLQSGARFAKLSEVLLHWRDHGERTSRTDSAYSKDAFWRCKAAFLACGPLQGRKKIIVWGAGNVGKRLGRYLLHADVQLVGFIDIDPKKIGSTRQDLPVWAPEELAHHRDAFVLACVGSRGARELIRARLNALGFREEESFLCAA